MPDYQPTATFDDPPIVQPDDGEAADAESVNEALRALSNRTAFLRRLSGAALVNATRTLAITTGITRHLYDVCFGAGAGELDFGLFLAVGSSDADAYRLITSSDGETWNSMTTGSPNTMLACAHGGSGAFGSRMFVIVGRDATARARIWTAPDGDSAPVLTTRTPATGPGATDALNGVVWSEPLLLWCAAGEAGAIMTSPDGITWTARTRAAGYTGDFKRVIAISSGANAGRLIAAGTGGVIQISDDGATWQETNNDSSPVGNDVGEITALVEVDGVTLASTNLGSTVLRSVDAGATWSQVGTIPTAPLEGFSTDLQETLVVLAGVVGAVLKATGSERRMLALSFDRGLTWPVVHRLPATTSGLIHRAAASDGERIVFAGGDSGLATTGFAAASQRLPNW